MKARLTAERLFSNPPLTGDAPRDVRVSPDGRCASWLRVAEDDRERLDLWGADLESGRPECWLKATDLPSETTPGVAERDERERRRLFGHGINRQTWRADSMGLLIEASGTGYLLDAQTRSTRRITPSGHRYTDIRLSSRCLFISYVENGSLYLLHLESGIERAVARSGEATVSFGTADFLAQEEMHRFDGHWWSPDDSAIAFTRVDVAPVDPIRRFGAGGLQTVRQRYPFAGASNPAVELGRYDLASGETSWLTWSDDPDDYLARVGFANRDLILQVQNRAQNRLRVKVVPPRQSRARLLFEETSETWVNLNDNFTPLGRGDCLWTSERDGFSHLYRHRDGKLEQLTRGAGHIEKVLHADSERALVSGWFETPTERHLYSIALDTRELSRLTSAGWHEVTASRDGQTLLDWCSSLGNPGELRARRANAPFRTLSGTRIDGNHPYRQYLDSHSTPTLGSLKAEDGQVLHYRLTRPRTGSGHAPGSGFPLIVWVYGGPGAQTVRNAWPPLALQLFAQNGFGVLELDNRGTANRGRAFEKPLFRRLGDTEVCDQVAGARHAAGLEWVDGNRIGVFGHSYGGYMTLMCMARAPDLFRAGASVAPVTDWRLYDTHYTERYLGHPEDNAEGYEASSVFPWLDGLRGKLLVMHGMADDNVLYAHTMKLQRALQERHIPFELMTYPGSKHALQERDVSIHRFKLVLDFFRRAL
ncbi:MAG: DPP IV N-terminal domain-containing protein [Gammaproteobacteria bacterium]|nr:DPP IV N-terminal domain-containing protein [Gammaproteobacteria bacterium]MDE0368279.1 DPP IV N-terminal domain-containing protein [Gammaproteobacteria bacterium]